MASDARRLKALEEENGKLKKLLAEAMLDSPEEDKSLQWIDLPRGDPEGCRCKKMVAMCHVTPLVRVTMAHV